MFGRKNLNPLGYLLFGGILLGTGGADPEALSTSESESDMVIVISDPWKQIF